VIGGTLIGGGFVLIAKAWRVLYEAQRQRALATTGAYAHVRHPQYAGFILVMLGFLLQWPTLLTLVMFSVLVVRYLRLARREEREALAEFGDAYPRHMADVPAPSRDSHALPAVHRAAACHTRENQIEADKLKRQHQVSTWYKGRSPGQTRRPGPA
jgi:hypothetical protein